MWATPRAQSSEVWTRKKPSIDDTPHQLFVEMDELRGEAWVETARWIKYEEDLEAERGDWGPPHVASLSFHSLMQLRKCLEHGGLMLDTRASDLSSLLTELVGKLVKEGKVEEKIKSKVLSVLLYRHLHVRHKTSFTFKSLKW